MQSSAPPTWPGPKLGLFAGVALFTEPGLRVLGSGEAITIYIMHWLKGLVRCFEDTAVIDAGPAGLRMVPAWVRA